MAWMTSRGEVAAKKDVVPAMEDPGKSYAKQQRKKMGELVE
jgi:hypothetical protein